MVSTSSDEYSHKSVLHGGFLESSISFAIEPYKRDMLSTSSDVYSHKSALHGFFLELSTSFAKKPYKRDYILQKKPIILRSLLIVATPYQATPYLTSQHYMGGCPRHGRCLNYWGSFLKRALFK